MNQSFPILLVLSCISVKLAAQDVEQSVKDAKQTLKNDPLSVNGSVGANAVFYQADGIPARRDPFYWVFTANINLTLLNKISCPFSAIITKTDYRVTNGLDKFNRPFNQFGISPRYKWLTVHAGFRSVEFSEYSLAGAIFLGGGVEVKTEKSLLSGSAIYGRFVKAVPQGGIEGVAVSLPSYERRGGGAKVRLGNENSFAELIVLKIRDEPHSIPFDTSLTVTPQENEIIAVGGKQNIRKSLALSGDISYSMFTKNIFQKETKIESFTYVNQIYTPRPSSQFNKALNVGLDFTPGKFRFGLKYKRVDPDYRSLGAIFLTNDIEELSANTNFTFYKNKIAASSAIGLQRNNLDKIQIMTSQRIIGSANLSCNLMQNLNLNLNFSNFSSNTIVVRDVFTDTLSFVQLTQNAGISVLYSVGGKKIKHSVSNISTYQESGGNRQALTTFMNETLSYNLTVQKLGFGINLSAMYNTMNNGDFGQNKGYGPHLGIQKTFLKNKIRCSLYSGYQETFLNSQPVNKNLTTGVSASIVADKHQTIKIDCNYLEKQAISVNAQAFSEIRGSVSYNYNFGLKKKNFIKTSG